MKISIVTAVRNDPRVVNAIESVHAQTYENVEHIIVDGMSTDGTSERIDTAVRSDTVVIREPDSGLYDAINKGIRYATGEVVGFLNADDRFEYAGVLSDIAATLQGNDVEIVYGNVRYVNGDGKTVRTWRSRPYVSGLFRRSWTPAHPTFYTYRRNYERFGLYRTDFSIAADVELMYRFLEVHRLSSKYVPETFVEMSAGGISNNGIGATWRIYREVRQGILENGGSFNDFLYLFSKALKAKERFLHHNESS